MKRVGEVLLVLILLGGCSDDGPSIPTDTQLETQSLNESITSLATSPLSLEDSELRYFDNLFQSARIVALGEATHGTSEFFSMKFRLFRYMVENHGYRVFSIEADMGESIFINNYIHHGQGDLTQIMNEKMLFWTWKTREVLEMIEWMRQYNESASDEEKLWYVGVDAQFTEYQHGWLKEYLEAHDVTLYKAHQDVLEQIDQIGFDGFGQLSEMQFEDIITNLELFLAGFDQARERLAEASSDLEFEIHKRLVVSLIQTVTSQYRGAIGEGYQRDLAMAENLKWVVGLDDNRSKSAFWAHNEHIRNNGGRVGEIMRKTIGFIEYAAVGFSFGEGWFQAYDGRTGVVPQELATSLEGSLNELFASASSENFSLIFNHASTSPELLTSISLVTHFLVIGCCYTPGQRYAGNGLANGAYYLIPMRITGAFDAIIHIQESNPTQLLR